MYEDMIAEIKKKMELRHLSDDFVKKRVIEYLVTHPKARDLSAISAKDKALMIKRIRAECRKAYGMFFTRTAKKRDKVLKQYLENTSEENLRNLLSVHKSSKERLDIYSLIFSEIFSVTGKPSSILDLGCGMNPLAIDYMGLSSVSYYAWDISKDDLEFISRFFSSRKGVKLHVKDVDLLDLKNVEIEFPKVDVCFMFKLLDHVDLGKGHKLSEKLIESVPAKWIVVSFSAKTLSNKPMRHPQRGWFERMCNRLGYSFKYIQKVGEVFYVVKK